MVRGEDGELHEASWPEALNAAAQGLKEKRVGVLVGGRSTLQDAYGYSKFARVALNTNDIDFRSRFSSAEESSFLSSIALGLSTTYKDLDKADQVVLLGFEPEDESPIVFLRLYKQVRKRGMKVVSDATYASRGSKKLNATLISSASQISNLTEKSVVILGERAAEVSGLISTAVELSNKAGAKLAWIPRRAGERGALQAGAIGTLLPGGRPVSDASARVDVAAAWGVANLPSNNGRSTDEILSALNKDASEDGALDAVVIGGVDPMDISASALSQLLNTFVVSLEISHSSVTAIADVVLPVAAVVEKSGGFVDWQGSVRPFEKAVADAAARSDVKILSSLADAMGTPINLPTVSATTREINSLGNWDGSKPNFQNVALKDSTSSLELTSWRNLLDLGALQEGEANLAGTARKSVVHISANKGAELGVKNGDSVKISSETGSITLPVEISEMADNKVWVPRNSFNSQVIPSLGFVRGDVKVVKA
jgi:NADH-quinone oxidoreductase subunit G